MICSADNSSGVLLPGMTATIDFVADSREQVQAVTNSSLNITMPEFVLKEMMEEMKKKMTGRERPVRGKRPERNTESDSDIIGVLWYIAEDGSFGRTMVEKGLSDGIHTEITKIKNLPDNAMIITKVNGTHSTTTTSNNSRNRMPGGPGPGLF